MFAKTVPVFHWKLHFLRPQLVTLPRDLYHKKAAQFLSKMKTEIENLFELGSLNNFLRARFKQFLLRLSCARVLVCVIQKDFNFDWLTNNALRWQTNSQEAFLANIILRTARERRKRKTRAFAAGCSVLSPSRAPLAQPLKKITGASFWNSERLPDVPHLRYWSRSFDRKLNTPTRPGIIRFAARSSLLTETLTGSLAELKGLFTSDFTLTTSTDTVGLRFVKRGRLRSDNTEADRHHYGQLRELFPSLIIPTTRWSETHQPCMSEVSDTPISNNHGGTNSPTQ